MKLIAFQMFKGKIRVQRTSMWTYAMALKRSRERAKINEVSWKFTHTIFC